MKSDATDLRDQPVGNLGWQHPKELPVFTISAPAAHHIKALVDLIQETRNRDQADQRREGTAPLRSDAPPLLASRELGAYQGLGWSLCLP